MTSLVYPEYKASGVEWLGDVPSHWRIIPLKQIAAVVNGYPFDSKAFNGERGYPLIRIRDLGAAVAETYYDGEFVEAAAITSDDVLIGMDGDFNVGRWRGGERALLNQRVCCIRGHSELVTRLLEYALPIPLKAINDVTYSTTVKHLSSYQVEKIRVALPPGDEEQTAIASFLERETAKIDTLVEEQKRLIDLLKEKRQAVISHAVTKGLNPDAPMKNSGIEWLGEVPEHWSLAPIGSRYSVQLGKMLDTDKITGEDLRPYLRVADVQWGKINTEDLPEMDFDEHARKRFALQAGDLLVNEGGSYVGRSALWQGGLDECYYQKALHRLRPHCRGQDTTEFLYFLMSHATTLGVFVAGGNQNTIDHLPAEKLRRYRFGFPTLQEQQEIADHLKGLTARFDLLIAAAEAMVAILRERREAQISAAVTGKIDVRSAAQSRDAAE